FFFSSRRRHTICYRDWSSDVCSSDLWGLVLCGVALAGCVFQVLSGREGWLRPLIGAALCGLMCGLLAWASTVALPRAEAARRTQIGRASCRERGESSGVDVEREERRR